MLGTAPGWLIAQSSYSPTSFQKCSRAVQVVLCVQIVHKAFGKWSLHVTEIALQKLVLHPTKEILVEPYQFAGREQGIILTHDSLRFVLVPGMAEFA